MKAPHQIRPPTKPRCRITENDLLRSRLAATTEEGFVRNVDVALQYIESWLRGNGCVPINNLMEDAATAEISRAQIWQWIRYSARLGNGKRVDHHILAHAICNVLNQRRHYLGVARYASSKFERAAELLRRASTVNFKNS